MDFEFIEEIEMSGKIVIDASIMAKMIAYDLSQPGKETAGLLIGELRGDDLHIDEVRIGDQEGNAVYVEITEQELINAVIEISGRKDGKSIVGWIHTHPSLSSFMFLPI